MVQHERYPISIDKLKINTAPKEMPIARLEINHLDIHNNIYRLDSIHNTVEENVQLLEGSVFPDSTSSIVFLAAHSGNSNISYFEKLINIKLGDQIYLYYQNQEYIYKVYDIYEVNKDGDIEVNKTEKHQLVLTTCSPRNIHKQLIVNSKLIE